MKSVGVVAGVALTIALSFFALTCAAKSPPLGSPSPNLHLPLRTVHDIALSGGAIAGPIFRLFGSERNLYPSYGPPAPYGPQVR